MPQGHPLLVGGPFNGEGISAHESLKVLRNLRGYDDWT